MDRRVWQSVGIVLIMLAGIFSVTAVGILQGTEKASLEYRGIEVPNKTPWGSAVHELGAIHLEKNTVVYVTQTGSKFHLKPDCNGLRNAKKVIGTTFALAGEQGKTICSLCQEEAQKKETKKK